MKVVGAANMSIAMVKFEPDIQLLLLSVQLLDTEYFQVSASLFTNSELSIYSPPASPGSFQKFGIWQVETIITVFVT